VATVHAPAARIGWIDRAGAVGAILFAVGLLVSFFTSSDSGETAESLIAYAEDAEFELWWSQILALLMPILIGLFVASLAGRLRSADETLRAATVIGGTLFIAFVGVGLTLWSAPLLSADELTTAGAEAYLAFDDAGWILLGLGGVGAGVMIIAVSLAALGGRWLPTWAGWLSLLLGVVALATIVAVGIFAWAAWLLAAGLLLLWRPRVAPTD
jgi:hypothetical protein